ncbi:MAG: hypothetical protein JNK43_02125 [Ignavibacteria bacterium]|nr:hypothetical protein [Ignavibacteria bacterium]
MKEADHKAKKRKEAEKELGFSDYDSFELEFKMMENQMYSWLISSAYPQVNSRAEKNNNKKRKTKNIKSKGE